MIRLVLTLAMVLGTAGFVRADEPELRLSPKAIRDEVHAVVDELRPDVVHCHSSVVSPLAWLRRYDSGRPRTSR